ncbi:DUF4023 domain-containing protein [Neobacillus muris]|nr:DUF4023 domain-containing protein [Neobacillus muris]
MNQENTHEFVEKIHEKQAKDQKNRQQQGTNKPSKQLPNKQH